MSRAWALYRREVGTYFVSPTGYLVLAAFLFLVGYLFDQQIETAIQYGLPARFMDTFFNMAFLVHLIVPLVTMRLLAEEKRTGTIESLMTAPVTEAQVVAAKYASALTFYAALLVPTAALSLLLGRYATVDWGEIAVGYLGLFLMGAGLIALGLFISSLCSSQVTAGVVTLILGLALLFSGAASQGLLNLVPGAVGRFLAEVVEALSVLTYMEAFVAGIIDARHVVFFVSVALFFLLMTTLVLESRRWR